MSREYFIRRKCNPIINFMPSNILLILQVSICSPMFQSLHEGSFVWDTEIQSYILSSFFYGYVITQIPFGILSKKYGARCFLGVGMLINSVFGLLVPYAANRGIWWLIGVRFIQGLGEVSEGLGCFFTKVSY